MIEEISKDANLAVRARSNERVFTEKNKGLCWLISLESWESPDRLFHWNNLFTEMGSTNIHRLKQSIANLILEKKMLQYVGERKTKLIFISQRDKVQSILFWSPIQLLVSLPV